MKTKKEIKAEGRLKKALEKYPFLQEPDKLKYSKQGIVKYAKALDKYPDLKELPIKLVIRAYDFREEILKEYRVQHTSALADARSDIWFGGFLKPLNIPEDLPSFDFDKECIACFRRKKGLSICPECWQLLRKALEIKTERIADGWDGWGAEIGLDLSNIVKLLASDEDGDKVLKETVEKIKKEEKEMTMQHK